MVCGNHQNRISDAVEHCLEAALGRAYCLLVGLGLGDVTQYDHVHSRRDAGPGVDDHVVRLAIGEPQPNRAAQPAVAQQCSTRGGVVQPLQEEIGYTPAYYLIARKRKERTGRRVCLDDRLVVADDDDRIGDGIEQDAQQICRQRGRCRDKWCGRYRLAGAIAVLRRAWRPHTIATHLVRDVASPTTCGLTRRSAVRRQRAVTDENMYERAILKMAREIAEIRGWLGHCRSRRPASNPASSPDRRAMLRFGGAAYERGGV